MSNYSKTTNFAVKDALLTGDPLKVVKGTDLNTEFDNIATAVSSKTDSAGAAITSGSIAGTTIGSSNLIAMGTGSGTGTLSCVASINTTFVGNVGAGEDDLMTYTLPANSFSSNGKAVRISAWGNASNNANVKTLRFYFGANTFNGITLTVSIASDWTLRALIVRTGSSAQIALSELVQINAGTNTISKIVSSSGTVLAATDSSAITIKATGQATADNDIGQAGMLIEFLN